MRSPKDKFIATVNFNKPVKGIGSEVMFSANDIDQLKSYAKMYSHLHGTIVIKENKKSYPEFDWVKVETIKF